LAALQADGIVHALQQSMGTLLVNRNDNTWDSAVDAVVWVRVVPNSCQLSDKLNIQGLGPS